MPTGLLQNVNPQPVNRNLWARDLDLLPKFIIRRIVISEDRPL